MATLQIAKEVAQPGEPSQNSQRVAESQIDTGPMGTMARKKMRKPGKPTLEIWARENPSGGDKAARGWPPGPRRRRHPRCRQRLREDARLGPKDLAVPATGRIEHETDYDETGDLKSTARPIPAASTDPYRSRTRRLLPRRRRPSETWRQWPERLPRSSRSRPARLERSACLHGFAERRSRRHVPVRSVPSCRPSSRRSRSG